MLMLKRMGAGAASALLVVLALVFTAPAANAVSILDLTVYNSSGDSSGFNAQLAIDCSAGTSCDFTFENLGPNGSIDDLWFETGFSNYFDTASLDYAKSTSVDGLDFSESAHPTSPPAAPALSWSGTWKEFDRNGGYTNGIGAGEALTITLGLLNGITITDSMLTAKVLDMIQNMIVAVHANECSTGNSCEAYATPIPGAAWLLGSALLGLFGFAGRRRSMAG